MNPEGSMHCLQKRPAGPSHVTHNFSLQHRTLRLLHHFQYYLTLGLSYSVNISQRRPELNPRSLHMRIMVLRFSLSVLFNQAPYTFIYLSLVVYDRSN
jgi:hypothetical protein